MLTQARHHLLQCFPQALAVYAFGSRVSGQADTHSDLDLAILLPNYADPLQRWHCAQTLAAQLNCDVDLLDLRAASTVMQAQILQTGQRLWAKDIQADLFECYVLNEKLALDEARAPYLQHIQTTGKIYHG